jgi:hypothetical protein
MRLKIISLKRTNKLANAICFLLIIALSLSCNLTVEQGIHLQTSTIKVNEIKIVKDSIKVEKDSIFIVKGLPLEVNGVTCYWEYKVKKGSQTNKNVSIQKQTLKTCQNNKILFETSNFDEEDNSQFSLKSITNSKVLNVDCIDINDDGYCDFKILIERAAAGANETHEVFLFNPKLREFELSEVFSGTNVEYDKEKNRISFMLKMGARMYSFGYTNLNKNKRDIDFVENINQNQDTIVYTKSINKKIIKTKRVILQREDWQGDEVNFGDAEYLLERNRK